MGGCSILICMKTVLSLLVFLRFGMAFMILITLNAGCFFFCCYLAAPNEPQGPMTSSAVKTDNRITPQGSPTARCRKPQSSTQNSDPKHPEPFALNQTYKHSSRVPYPPLFCNLRLLRDNRSPRRWEPPLDWGG